MIYYRASYDSETDSFSAKLFHDKGPYHIETSPVICCATQWTGFYMIGTSVMKELKMKCEIENQLAVVTQFFLFI